MFGVTVPVEPANVCSAFIKSFMFTTVATGSVLPAPVAAELAAVDMLVRWSTILYLSLHHRGSRKWEYRSMKYCLT